MLLQFADGRPRLHAPISDLEQSAARFALLVSELDEVHPSTGVSSISKQSLLFIDGQSIHAGSDQKGRVPALRRAKQMNHQSRSSSCPVPESRENRAWT
jgi:hypothetical protein